MHRRVSRLCELVLVQSGLWCRGWCLGLRDPWQESRWRGRCGYRGRWMLKEWRDRCAVFLVLCRRRGFCSRLLGRLCRYLLAQTFVVDVMGGFSKTPISASPSRFVAVHPNIVRTSKMGTIHKGGYTSLQISTCKRYAYVQSFQHYLFSSKGEKASGRDIENRNERSCRWRIGSPHIERQMNSIYFSYNTLD
jgi:hypothetical protein